MQFRKNKSDINFTLVYNTSFLYVLQIQKRIMCIFWWHKFGLFVHSFMGCATDKWFVFSHADMGFGFATLCHLHQNNCNQHLIRLCHVYKLRFLCVTITMTSQWAWWRLRSPASRLLTQLFIQKQIKKNVKALRHWPLCGEFTGTGEFPAQRASYAEYVSIWWRHHHHSPVFLGYHLNNLHAHPWHVPSQLRIGGVCDVCCR